MLCAVAAFGCGCVVCDCVVWLCRAVAVLLCGVAVCGCEVVSRLVVLFGYVGRVWYAVACVVVLCEVVV